MTEKKSLPPDNAGHRKRLRAKLLSKGDEIFEDYEFLELVLTRVFRRIDTKPIAKALIRKFGSFPAVLYANPDDLREVKGIGDTAIAEFKTEIAVAKRLAHYDMQQGPILDTWIKLLDYCFLKFSAEPIEHFHILYLDLRHKLIKDEELQHGTVNHTPVYPREMIKRILNLNASYIILVHNHPSGDPEPSAEDIRLTQKIKGFLEPVSVKLLDHIVIGKEKRIYSFRKEGLI